MIYRTSPNVPVEIVGVQQKMGQDNAPRPGDAGTPRPGTAVSRKLGPLFLRIA